jgi:hypothetical protein
LLLAAALAACGACSKEQPATLSRPGEPAQSAPAVAPVAETTPDGSVQIEAAAPSAPASPPALPQPPKPSQPQPPPPTPAPSLPPAPTPSPAPSHSPPSLAPASTRTSSAHWNVDFSTPGCASGTDCSATLRLEALGEYHVNPDYHFRFVPNAVAGVAFSAGGPADFALQGPKVGVMSVHFNASAPGPVTLSGTFKICVCTDAVCAPEPVSVSLPVTVR